MSDIVSAYSAPFETELVTYPAEEFSWDYIKMIQPSQPNIDHVVCLLKLVRRFNDLGHVHQASELLDVVLDYLGAPAKEGKEENGTVG